MAFLSWTVPVSGAVCSVACGAACSALLLTGLLTGCSAHGGLPSYSTVPDFSLTDQTGSTFDSAAKLRGKVWVADFIYTTGPGPCPRMSSQMHEVQKAFAGVDGFRLVSFTVDPSNDTPAVLAEYAKHFDTNPGMWFFLTGTEHDLHHLCWAILTGVWNIRRDLFWSTEARGFADII